MSRLRAVILLLVALLAGPASAGHVNPCATGGANRPIEGGIGGTGASDDGIGGTGRRPGPGDDDGIGGTGITHGGDTGLIGTITGFASICVGTVEVRYDAVTPIHIDGAPGTAARLAVGEVVEVMANGRDTGLTAREISVRHVVTGPVTSVDAEHDRIVVIGQTVQLGAATRADGGDEPAVATAFGGDTYVAVSGLRRSDGVIVASRVSRGEPSEIVHVTGPVDLSEAGAATIAGTAVEPAGALEVTRGGEVRIVGRWTGTGVRALSVEVLPSVPFDGRMPHVAIEGFARAADGGRVRVGGFVVARPEGDAERTLRETDVRVRVEGRVRDREVVIERVDVLDGMPARPAPPGPRGGRERDAHRFRCTTTSSHPPACSTP